MSVARTAVGLVATRPGLRYVSASQLNRRILHCCVAADRRPNTRNRVETVREWPLGFHLVQVPVVDVGIIERVTPKSEAR